MGNIRGLGFIGANEYFLQIGGQAGVRKIKDAMSEEDRRLFSRAILPNAWISYPAYMRYLLTADKILGSGDFQLIREASRYNARKDFTGIYKIFLKMASPWFVIKNSNLFWQRYYDQGQLKMTRRLPQGGQIVLTRYPDIPLHHEIDNLPYCEEFLMLSGAKNARLEHTTCMALGESQCTIDFYWE